MKQWTMAAIAILMSGLFCSQAQATHIQYVESVDDLTGASFTAANQTDTWSYTFDLLNDSMDLWEIDTHYDSANTTPDTTASNYVGTGSYNPTYALHYVTLRIDPKNLAQNGGLISQYLGLQINGIAYDPSDWENPMRLYDWGVPGGGVTDLYNIAANNYKITVTLTGLNNFNSDTAINVDNVNIEGCYDTAPIPEPATMFLFGSGLVSLAGFIRRKNKG